MGRSVGILQEVKREIANLGCGLRSSETFDARPVRETSTLGNKIIFLLLIKCNIIFRNFAFCDCTSRSSTSLFHTRATFDVIYSRRLKAMRALPIICCPL